MPYVNLIFENTGLKTQMISSLINPYDKAQSQASSKHAAEADSYHRFHDPPLKISSTEGRGYLQ